MCVKSVWALKAQAYFRAIFFVLLVGIIIETPAAVGVTSGSYYEPGGAISLAYKYCIWIDEGDTSLTRNSISCWFGGE